MNPSRKSRGGGEEQLAEMYVWRTGNPEVSSDRTLIERRYVGSRFVDLDPGSMTFVYEPDEQPLKRISYVPWSRRLATDKQACKPRHGTENVYRDPT